jgi:hypothetical protein
MYYKKKLIISRFSIPPKFPGLEENQAKDDKLLWEILKKKRKY